MLHHESKEFPEIPGGFPKQLRIMSPGGHLLQQGSREMWVSYQCTHAGMNRTELLVIREEGRMVVE